MALVAEPGNRVRPGHSRGRRRRARIALGDTLRPDALLFGESTGRVVASTRDPEALVALARSHDVPARQVGETGGDRLVVGRLAGEAWMDTAVEQLQRAWQQAIPRRLEEG